MLVRLVTEYRWGGITCLPGGVLRVPDMVAAKLVEEGVAVPERKLLAAERR